MSLMNAMPTGRGFLAGCLFLLVCTPAVARQTPDTLGRGGRGDACEAVGTRPLDFGGDPGGTFGMPKKVVVEQEDPCLPPPSWPARSVADAAGLLPGVDRKEGADSLRLRAGLEPRAPLYLDGLRVPEGIRLPWLAVRSVEVFDGHVPARYGDALGSVVVVTSRQPTPKRWRGRLEALTSEATDAYGYHEAGFALAGPLMAGRGGVFLSGSYVGQRDGTPSALRLPRLRKGLLRDLLANPEAVRAVNPNDPADVRYLTVPGDLPAGASPGDLLDRLGLPAGFDLDLSSRSRAATLAGDAYVMDAAQAHNGRLGGTLAGHLHVDVLPDLRLALGGYYDAGRKDRGDYVYTLFNDAPFSRTDERAGRLYAALRHQISPSVSYHLAASFAEDGFTTYHPAFSTDVRDVLFYGDVDHPANAVAARYLRYDADAQVYTQRFGDGSFPDPVQSLFSAPGAAASLFIKENNRQFFASGHAEVRVGGHAFEAGGAFEQRAERRFALGPYALARAFNDGHVEAGQEAGVGRYDELDFDALYLRVRYLGYNYLGTEAADDQDVDAFATRQNVDIAPFKPLHYAGYLRDTVRLFDRLTLDLGLRLDVFDHAGTVLRDPFALLPIVRAGDVAGVPPSIGPDYAVYFNDAEDAVVGYRDPDGNFYDQGGQAAAASQVRNTGHLRLARDDHGNEILRLAGSIFADYTPQLRAQPRLGVNVRALRQTWLFGYFDRMARQPWAFMRATPQQYERTFFGNFVLVDNPALKPERVTSYGLGFWHQESGWGAVVASAFQRDYAGLADVRFVGNVFPNNYLTYANAASATVKGLEAAVETERLYHLKFKAGYTLQEAVRKGRPSLDFVQAAPIAFFPDQDRRHQVKLLLDYRLGAGEGPTFLGGRPLAHFGLSVFADLKSGRPYTKRDDESPLYTAFDGFLEGSVNGRRMPWSYLINLRLERAFTLAGARLTLYAWAQNLLDADNVLDVWEATGLPDQDRYLTSPLGRANVRALEQNQGAQVADAFETMYRFRLNEPDHYGIPRQVRLGLRVDF